jgi:hypothetical protein
MNVLVIVVLLLAIWSSQGGQVFRTSSSDLGASSAGLNPVDWHPPLLPPEVLVFEPIFLLEQAPRTNTAKVHPMDGPPGTILGVMRGHDKQILRIHYSLDGRTNEQVLKLSEDVADFHFCSWVRDRGIALAVSDSAGGIYWAAAYFAHLEKPVYPHKIRAPDGYKLMGIANTRGDTIVVTALDHRDETTPRGWMYINSCPPAWNAFFRAPTNGSGTKIQISGFDHLRHFEVPPKVRVSK